MKKRPNDDGRRKDLGDETGDASSPRPDENVVSEIGEEIGVTSAEDEPVHPTVDKLSRRDAKRWELDPASAEDFDERERRRAQDDV